MSQDFSRRGLLGTLFAALLCFFSGKRASGAIAPLPVALPAALPVVLLSPPPLPSSCVTFTYTGGTLASLSAAAGSVMTIIYDGRGVKLC